MSHAQFNLLPDVKLESLKTHRARNFVVAISIVVAGVSLFILLLLVGMVEVVQKKQMSDAQKDLNNANSQLGSISDLNKIVTVQNQLYTLSGLHKNKHMASRIFDYLAQLTPTNASIRRLDLDLTQSTLSINGNADSQKTVNTFIDTLKFTTYKAGDTDSPHPAFSSVVETNFAINASNVTYSLDMQFDPKLFANNLTDSQGRLQAPKLSVPSLTTTRIGDPTNSLFNR